MYPNKGTSTRQIFLTFSSIFHFLLPRKGVIPLLCEVGKRSGACPFPLPFVRSPSYRDRAFGLMDLGMSISEQVPQPDQCWDGK